MEIDNLQAMERGTQSFGSRDIGPQLLNMCEELIVQMSFLNPDPEDNS